MTRSTYYPLVLLFLLLFFFQGCSSEPDTPFRNLPPSQTGIYFSNDVESTPEFNIQNYLYFYDGGGVAAGDINNDGLPDLFFTGNMVQNRLYLNKGDFEFEDITESAGISDSPDSWSTGVTMADVTGNGYLDIYVSRVNFLNKSGHNQLFINNGDNTFTESAAEYGLDFVGYSTQAAFFDYNKNGRLDLFLLNHTFHSDDTYGEAQVLRQNRSEKGGDKLFRNEGDRFTDVTEEAGIYSSALGYGLGLAITDLNQDGHPDIYVGNDFHEDDYLYINNGNGTFTESAYSYFSHTSNSSMGNDVGDIMNNGRMDVLSLDMMAEDHSTFMRSAGPDLVVIAQAKKNFGYGDKNNRNTLQINRGYDSEGNPLFSETAFASGMARTDWSWSALLADYDNNGFKDLYITNGIPRRPNNLDYVARLRQIRERFSGKELEEKEYALEEIMPINKIPNYAFKNNEDFTFQNVTEEWGFTASTYSNGAVYADLNNNGRLDLVLNNINEQAFVYENRGSENDISSYLKFTLRGTAPNTTGIGTKLFLYHNDSVFYREQMPVRGFQSSVDQRLHVGLGYRSEIDSMLVVWPDGTFEKKNQIVTNQTIELHQADAEGTFDYSELKSGHSPSLFSDISEIVPEDLTHRENIFDDFSREPLIPYALSKRGPAMAVGDVNGNGLDDIFLGGGREFPAKLFIQVSPGVFEESNSDLFMSDRRSEDVDALFFDATGDGNLDLYVVTGGHEYTASAPDLADKLYINQGDGQFQKSLNSIPEVLVNASVVTAADFNGDGHLDLFVGGHSVPWRYGIGPQSRLLQNNGLGVFEDVTEEIAPEIVTIGNVTSAVWLHNSDSEIPDLVIAGEWMPIEYFVFEEDKFVRRTEEMGFAGTNGLWQSLHTADLTNNGNDDLIAGNFGINSRIQPSPDSPMRLYVNDYNDDGQTIPLITYMVNGKEHLFEPLDELLNPLPNITGQIRNYQDYSQKTVRELISEEKLDSALQKQIHTTKSAIFIQSGSGPFQKTDLNWEAQTFPVFGIYSEDFNSDGNADILLTGNLFDVKPSMGGKQDASYGLYLEGAGNGEFAPLSLSQSGIYVNGQGRKIAPIQTNGEIPEVIFARNNQKPLIFRYNGQ